MKPAQIMVLVFLCVPAYRPVQASAVESYRYTETIGGVKKDIRWCVDKSEPIRLLYQSKEEMHITRTDDSFATVQWDMKNEAEGTSIQARREPHAIIIRGQWEGGRFTKELSVDDAPWYQATSWSLRAFVLSSLKEIRFWTVRTDTLTAHKITAVKKKRRILNLNGANEEAVEVELRLGGLLSVFWKSNYWFRRTDGVFLRFEGPSGPPGAPDVIVEYQGPAPPCEMSALGTPSGIPLNHSESRQQMISDMSILHLK